MSNFIYLLNAMENAAREERPADHDYKGKREAVLEYVAALEQQPRAAVPSEHYIMPAHLTAENGAKSALSGEFHEELEITCSACNFDEPEEDCEECGGEVTYSQRVPVSWRTIKLIYRRAVQLLGAPPPPAVPCPPGWPQHPADAEIVSYRRGWNDAVGSMQAVPAGGVVPPDRVEELAPAIAFLRGCREGGLADAVEVVFNALLSSQGQPEPERTGVGNWCSPGPADSQRRAWLLRFEDADRGDAVLYDEQEARTMFANAEAHGWNCHLFAHALGRLRGDGRPHPPCCGPHRLLR